MKIGLISINANTKTLNHACPLHTYAFQQFLLNNNIESTIINYKPNYHKNFNVKYPYEHFLKNPYKDEKKQEKELAKWKALYNARAERFDKFENFIDKYYIQTDKSYKVEDLDKIDLGFDCYICVTDVIWKPLEKTGFDRGFFLGAKTMNGKGKIAYAVSRGPKIYQQDKEAEYLEYLKDFNFVSVREASFKKYIKQSSGLDVPHVIDPVFLNDREFYENLAIKPTVKKGYVLVYVVMERNMKIVKQAVEFAKAHNLEVFEISENPNSIKKYQDYDHFFIYESGIEEWLGYMLDADYIFTNSFHSCCFSIIFEKQFFVGKRHGDKIDSLLAKCNLTSRRIATDIKGEELSLPDINYAEVRPLIKAHIDSSKEYILNAIKAIETGYNKTFETEIKEYIKKSDYHKLNKEQRIELQSIDLPQPKKTVKKKKPFMVRLINKIKRETSKLFD